jgi:sucrose-6-phosphate hydrolase SacC (GH32 family)
MVKSNTVLVVNKKVKPVVAERKSLRVKDYHAKNLEIEGNAPPTTNKVIIKRPKASELAYNASTAAAIQFSIHQKVQSQKAAKLEKFQQVTQQRASTALNKTSKSKNREKSSKAIENNDKTFQKAYLSAKESVEVFSSNV